MERNEFKPFENELENSYKRLDTFENMSYRQQRHGSSSNSCCSSALLRQRLDNLQMEVNALRNEANVNVQK